jgi:hypothetical protein
MNDTKWREICEAFRHWPKPPRFRIRDLLAPANFVSDWDGEWYYHPKPYVTIEWLEVELPEDKETISERGSSRCAVWGGLWLGATTTNMRTDMGRRSKPRR